MIANKFKINYSKTSFVLFRYTYLTCDWVVCLSMLVKEWIQKFQRFVSHIRLIYPLLYHINAIRISTHFYIRNIGKIRNLLSYDACSTIIHALISCRLDYCNSILYNVQWSKTDQLQRLHNQCARILTKSPYREHNILLSRFWKNYIGSKFKIDSLKKLMLTYKSYYNIAPSYLCKLMHTQKSHVNTRLGTDHHQLIMPPISKDCSNTFLEQLYIYAAPCEWNKLSWHIRPMLFTQQYGCWL